MQSLTGDSFLSKAISLVTTVAFVVALGGCITFPQTGVTANGEPLKIWVGSQTSWQAYQGKVPIDDQDLFQIAGDTKTAKRIADYRWSMVTMNRIGAGLSLGGASLLVVGVAASRDREATLPANSPWTDYAAFIGVFSLVTGVVFTLLTFRKDMQHPTNNPARANRVAIRYNKKLAAQAAPPPKSPSDSGEKQSPAQPQETPLESTVPLPDGAGPIRPVNP